MEKYDTTRQCFSSFLEIQVSYHNRKLLPSVWSPTLAKDLALPHIQFMRLTLADHTSFLDCLDRISFFLSRFEQLSMFFDRYFRYQVFLNSDIGEIILVPLSYASIRPSPSAAPAVANHRPSLINSEPVFVSLQQRSC